MKNIRLRHSKNRPQKSLASFFSIAVTIGTFNAEHFGSQKDFLLKNKLFATATMIRAASPEILVLNEVESTEAVHQLARDHLPALTTQIRLTTGPLMSPALVSKYAVLGKPEEVRIPRLQARSILKVTLDTPVEPIVILGFHFPSQFHSVSQRTRAFETLRHTVHLLKNQTWIALGDSNVTRQEEDHFHFFRGPDWFVSNEVGCFACQGTYYYKGLWSFFDVLFFSKRLSCKGASRYYVDPTSITTGLHEKYPFRWQKNSGQGSSDHFPIFATIRLKAENPVKNCIEDHR